jgi:hypothetical protein
MRWQQFGAHAAWKTAAHALDELALRRTLVEPASKVTTIGNRPTNSGLPHPGPLT